MIFVDNQFISKQTFHIQNPSIYMFSNELATLSYMLYGYEICLNTTNYLIFNMQDFIYWLCTSILNCFSQIVTPLIWWMLKFQVILLTLSLIYIYLFLLMCNWVCPKNVPIKNSGRLMLLPSYIFLVLSKPYLLLICSFLL